MPKYIVVTGGVISGLGKGIVTSSIGYLLLSQGYRVGVVKIDPYINIDAGTMRPTEHGEVYVTEDGGETDQDLGNYERFMNIDLKKINNITTGQVYKKVIERERNLEYNGKCVEVIPHIPLEVINRLEKAGEGNDFVLVEIGGTVGDYQNLLFLEAVREINRKNNCVVFVHVVYLPIPKNIGEMKTKPAQHSVRALNSAGIRPDFIVCRSSGLVDKVRREKIAVFCNVDDENVINAYDLDVVYETPILFEKQDFTEKILKKFGLKYKKNKINEWEKRVGKIKKLNERVKVGIVGKYFKTGDFSLIDSYISVLEAIKHAAWDLNYKPEIEWVDSNNIDEDSLRDLDCIIVPGGFGETGIDGKILAIKYARENDIPFLGLCYGMQLGVIEFARNKCDLKDANSVEINEHTSFPVIDVLEEQVGILKDKNYGGTMRLGSYKAVLLKNSLLSKLYKKDFVFERHRHRYEVNLRFKSLIEERGMIFSGFSEDRKLMEFFELNDHKFFVGTQAHPEFKSRFLNPHPLFLGLIKAAKS
ncbi:MAG: CTP synthase [Nanoarchaeota archaeon]|nr:CTP synthase [Nanoarchaeota archaeon]